MSTPVGHTLVGVALARRLGIRSRAGITAAIVLANLPDADVLAGLALRGDPWALHRRSSHSLRFAALAGAAAGAAGVLRLGERERPRDRLGDALAGALIGSSHIILDRLPYRSIRIGPRFLGIRVTNWVLDALQCALIAHAFVTIARRPHDSAHGIRRSLTRIR
jgi:membrane-bound metal-dependent hydrolase YbcI (DUF457 family)